jgi:hypothetical protein
MTKAFRLRQARPSGIQMVQIEYEDPRGSRGWFSHQSTGVNTVLVGAKDALKREEGKQTGTNGPTIVR